MVVERGVDDNVVVDEDDCCCKKTKMKILILLDIDEGNERVFIGLCVNRNFIPNPEREIVKHVSLQSRA